MDLNLNQTQGRLTMDWKRRMVEFLMFHRVDPTLNSPRYLSYAAVAREVRLPYNKVR